MINLNIIFNMDKVLIEPWGENIIEELETLKDKYTKLVNYINSEDFYTLSPNNRKLINNQKVLLESYINILSTRLYGDIDNSIVTDYSMFGLLLSTVWGSGNSLFNNNNADFQLPKQESEV